MYNTICVEYFQYVKVFDNIIIRGESGPVQKYSGDQKRESVIGTIKIKDKVKFIVIFYLT